MFDSETAVNICVKELALSTAALLARDFDAFARGFAIPHWIETFEGRRILTSLNELRDVFENVCDYYDSINVTDLARRIVSAEFKNATTIMAAHETRLICHGALQTGEPTIVLSELKEIDGNWKVMGSSYALSSGPLHSKALMEGRFSETNASR